MKITWISLKSLISKLSYKVINYTRGLSASELKLKKPDLVVIISKNSKPSIFDHKAMSLLVIDPKTDLGESKISKIRSHFRKSKTLIIQLNGADLIDQQLDKQLTEIKNSLTSLRLLLKKSVNAYIELSNLNEFTGYTEFFKNELRPQFGIDIKLKNNKKNELGNQIAIAYKKLLSKIWHIAKNKIDRNELTHEKLNIYLFSEAMKTLTAPINLLTKTLSGISTKKNQLILRGIYFCGNNGPQNNRITPSNLFEAKPIKAKIKTKDHYLLKNKLCQQAIDLIDLKYNSFCLGFFSRTHCYFFIITLCLFLSTSSFLILEKEYSHEIFLAEKTLSSLKLLKDPFILNSTNPIEIVNKVLQENRILNKSTHSLYFLSYSYKLNQLIHQRLNPKITELIYKNSIRWLESTLKLPKLKLDERYMASLAYASLRNTKNQHYFHEALCYFWLKITPGGSVESCSNLGEWLNPKSMLIDHSLLDKSNESLLSYSLVRRVFTSLYINSQINNGNHLYFNKEAHNSFFDQNNNYSFLSLFTKNYSVNLSKTLDKYIHETQFIHIDDETENLWNSDYLLEFNQLLRDETQKYWHRRLSSIHLNALKSPYDLEKLATQIKNKNSSLTKLTELIEHYQPEWLNSKTGYHYFDFNLVSEWLILVNQRLRTLNQSKSPEMASLNLLKSVIDAEPSSPFTSIIELANSAPFPINQWIYEIYQPVWLLFSKHFLDNLNRKWQQQIVPFYNEALKDHYPLAETEVELELDDFHYFFAPTQLLDSFFNENLSEFFNTQIDSLTLKNYAGLQLPLQTESIDFLNTVFFIKNHYFDQKTNLPKLEFNIKPVALSRNTRYLKLQFGAAKLNYQHGPQFNTRVIWPNNSDNLISSLKLIDFNSQNIQLSQTGNWGLFRLIDEATELDLDSEGISLSYEFPMQNCRFQISQLSDPSILNLNPIKSLNFPNKFSLETNSTAH